MNVKQEISGLILAQAKNIFLPFGEPGQINTERLNLMPVRLDDAHVMYPHITDAVTSLWIGWDTPKSQLDTTNAVLATLKLRERGEYQGWVARLNWDHRDGSDMVGVVELVRLETPARGGAWYELDFWVTEEQWGKGYATEMAGAVIEWIKRNASYRVPCVNFSWTHGNNASARVIKKFVGEQQPEIHYAEKNGVKLPVYHYVLDFSPPTLPPVTNKDSLLLEHINNR